jgi:uncharacterized membrane protein YheB (UPF0754 family)
MASKLSDLILGKLLSVQEIFDRIDAPQIAFAMSSSTSTFTAHVLSSVAEEELPKVWAMLTNDARAQIIDAVEPLSVEMTQEFIRRLQRDIHRVIDMKAMAVKLSNDNKERSVMIFEEVGHEELKFVKRSGMYFGFLFGIIQAGLWTILTKWYLLAVLGFVVGSVTNYLALLLCFNPKNEYALFGGQLRLHGAFLRRQKEASEKFALLVQSLFLNSRSLWAEAMEGERASEFCAVLHEFTHEFMRERSGALGRAMGFALGEYRMKAIASRVSEQVLKELPSLLELTYAMQDEALSIRGTLAERLKALSSEEFEEVLHPAFREDEWQLILIGGVLGFGAGAVQAFVYTLAVEGEVKGVL